MDEIDLKLLRLLQKNSRTPIKTLAGEIRLSSPAVSARIERLEKQGVIRAYTLDLDPLQLGHHILAYVHLDLQPEISLLGKDLFMEKDPKGKQLNVKCYFFLKTSAFPC